MAKKRKRIKCPRCGYSVRVRKDGTPQVHTLYAGNKPYICFWILGPRREANGG